MAVGTFTVFSKNKDDLRENDLASANLRMGLVTSSWTPDSSITGNSVWADMSGNEISGVNGYTTGGYSLTGTVSMITGGAKLATGNPTWTASGGSIAAWRYGVLYYLGSLWGMTNPVVGYFLGDTTPADIPATTTGNTLTINCPAGGWFDLT